MTTPHTPGPWATDLKLYGGQYNVGPVTQPNMTVARVNGRDGEQEANARLIAEAPAMLEALKDLNGFIRQCQDTLCDYLHPESKQDADETVSLLLELLDGARQREVQGNARAILARIEGNNATR